MAATRARRVRKADPLPTEPELPYVRTTPTMCWWVRPSVRAMMRRQLATHTAQPQPDHPIQTALPE